MSIENINIEEHVLKSIVNALVYEDTEADLLYQQSINNLSGIGVQNGKHQSVWSRRYNSISDIAESNGLKTHIIDRFIWKAVVLQDDSNTLYMFFNDKNLKDLMSKGKETHYAKLLVKSLNHAFDELKSLHSQISFDFLDNEDEFIYTDEYLSILSDKIINTFETEPENVVIFSFDSFSGYDKVSAYIYNTNFEVVWKKDLTYLIEHDYNPVIENDNVYPVEIEGRQHTSPKRIVKLKQK